MDLLKDEIKDFQEWTAPTSWNEVTLKQYQLIEKFYEDKDRDFDLREVLQIFCDKTEDEVNELPIEFAQMLLDKLSFIGEKLDWGEPSNSIEINGEKYTIHFENQLKTGEYVASDSVIKSDKHNYAAILGILCRKEGEIYDSHFENEVLPSRIGLFERQPITKILPLVGFFLQLSIVYMNHTQLYSRLEGVISLIHQNGVNSLKNGDLSALSTLWQTRKLKKSLKSIKSI